MGYDAQRELAQRMIANKGARVTFSRPGAAPDPVTQTGGGSPITYSASMIALPLSASKAAAIFGPGAATALKRRLSITIALNGATNTPLEGDQFTWGETVFRILSLDSTDPDGTGPILAQGYAEA